MHKKSNDLQQLLRKTSARKIRLKACIFHGYPALYLFMVFILAGLNASAQESYPFQNQELDSEARIDDLLSRMTLDEKVSALSTDPSVPRLGVKGAPHIEGYHGVAMGGPANWAPKGDEAVPTTTFPQAYGMGATWNPELIRRAGEIESIEARYIFQNPEIGKGGLVVRAPNADLGRDPRWGRTEECFGEDPFLVGTLATAFTKGLQGDDDKYWRTASLLKHFLANSNENGRDSSSSDFDGQLYHEYYGASFRRAFIEGGSNAYMAAYNAINGVPAHIHDMHKDITEKMWGVNGIKCTDGGGYQLLVYGHKYYDDLYLAAEGVIKAGLNQFLDDYREGVYGALAHGYLTEADIDEVLKGVYRVMIKLGQLDPAEQVPYATIGRDGEPAPWTTEKHRQAALKMARESVVLLKNSNNTLPLNADELNKVAVIGYLADTVLLDWYSGLPPYRITPLEGIRKKLGDDSKVLYAPDNDYNAAVEAASEADVAIVVLGNHPTCNSEIWADCPDPGMGREAVDRKTLRLTDEYLVKLVMEANPNTVFVLQSSFPYAINWSQQNVPAILHITHNGQETGTALADVLFGDYNPGGKLTQTWPKSEKQLPDMMEYDIRKGHTYMYFEDEPLYPFGHGLSYTTFAWEDISINKQSVPADDKEVTITVKLKNTGDVKGDEVVQLYASFPESTVRRPAKALKGFKRVTLEPGERKKIEIPIKLEDLAYWDIKKERFVVESGTVRIMAGASSADIQLADEFVIQ
ncbi:MAG: beta-glucosidase [Anaerophaga sp.]|nr:beta-glucosidase [Anaerophaga sp.]